MMEVVNLRYITSILVNVTMYPPYNKNMLKIFLRNTKMTLR
jgi:hypothetical protein